MSFLRSSFLDVLSASFSKFLPKSTSALLCLRMQIGRRDYTERGGNSNKLGTQCIICQSECVLCDPTVGSLSHRYYESFGIPIPETSVCSLLRNCFAIVCEHGPFEFTITPIANAPTNDRSITKHVWDLMRLSFTKTYSDCIFNREIIWYTFLESI